MDRGYLKQMVDEALARADKSLFKDEDFVNDQKDIFGFPVTLDDRQETIRQFQEIMRKYGQRTFGLKPFKPGDTAMTNGTAISTERLKKFEHATKRLLEKFGRISDDERDDLITRIHIECDSKVPIASNPCKDAIELPEPEPEPDSELSKQYRRRWVGGRYVDERING